MRVVIGPGARQDLEGVYIFLAQVNRRAAAKTHNDILDKAAALALSPKIGKIEPLLDDIEGEHRSLIAGRNYKIVYRIDEEAIYIIAVWDCRQNPSRLRTFFTRKRS